MPPLKTFEFVNLINSRITITIKAYSRTDAVETLMYTVKDAKDFKLK